MKKKAFRKGKTVPQMLEEAHQQTREMRQGILAQIELCLRAVVEAKGTSYEKKAEAILAIWMGPLEVVQPGLVKRYRAREAQLGRTLTPDEYRELRQAS